MIIFTSGIGTDKTGIKMDTDTNGFKNIKESNPWKNKRLELSDMRSKITSLLAIESMIDIFYNT